MIRIILAFGANFISSWIRIHIWNADPDPGNKFNADPCGSGSETLATIILIGSPTKCRSHKR
jgi:hypothetical protein